MCARHYIQVGDAASHVTIQMLVFGHVLFKYSIKVKRETDFSFAVSIKVSVAAGCADQQHSTSDFPAQLGHLEINSMLRVCVSVYVCVSASLSVSKRER